MYLFGLFLKKLISGFLLPLPLGLLIIFVGLVFLWFTKKEKIAKVFVTIGAAFIFFMSTGIITDIIITPLNNAYSAYAIKKNKPVKFIVVLSGGAGFRYGIPMNTSNSHVTLSRIMEGIRVYNCSPGSKIILTGGLGSSNIPSSVIEACFLIQMGIPKKDIILDTNSRDTPEEVLNVKRIINHEPFVLVTSSLHMTRAVKLFKKQGMDPIPAPADFITVSSCLSNYNFIIPNSKTLCSMDKAVHEYIGIIWEKIRGQI